MEITKGKFLGTISKTFGKNGEILLKFNPEYFEVLKKTESVLIEIDNVPVPFFISNIHFRNKKSAVITFKNYNHAEIMENFIGCEVYLDSNYTKSIDNPLLPFNIKGFRIVNDKLGEIGYIKNIIEYPNNTVIIVKRHNDEVILPFSEKLILEVDRNKKSILFDVPDGLIK